MIRQLVVEPQIDSSTDSCELEQAIRNRSAVVGVVGLGYVGLPLIRSFVAGGFRTLGFDIDQSKVERLLAGESYIRHISSAWIAEAIEEQRFEPTAEMARLREADVVLICVPTPLSDSRDPDLSYIRSTMEQIAAVLRPGQLVVLESTTYPGTTRDVVLADPRGERPRGRPRLLPGLQPRTRRPGQSGFRRQQYPEGRRRHRSRQPHLAQLLYASAVVQVVPVSNCEVAEACKILENTYRAVNIALVNELKVLFDRMGIDIWEVIEAAKTKPFGFQAFYPGPGLGGHCIPIDPFYLSWAARKHGLTTRFIELAGEINTHMPDYVVARTTEALNERGKPVKGSKICILGVAYKKDVDDPRESPAFELMELLAARGALLSYNDPYIPLLPAMRHRQVPPLCSAPLTAEFLAEQDCVLIATDHSGYDYDFIVRHASLIVDTRNATAKVREGRSRIRKA